MMKSTLGAPSFARSGAGQAGLDSPTVRPITPGNAVPGLYSTIALFALPPFFFFFRHLILRKCPTSCQLVAGSR